MVKAAKVLNDALSDVDEGPPPPEQFPPGAVGRLAQYIMDTSRNPNPRMALGAALIIIAKLADRRVAGPTNLTCVLFFFLLAETGIGKNRVFEVVKQVLIETGNGDLIGPGDFASVQSVQRLATEPPCNKLCLLDEAGIVLRRLLADSGNTNSVTITGVLNTLYTVGWGRFDSVIRAHGDPPLWSMAPAISIFGVSTPREFYETLTLGMIGSGFLGRLTVIEASPKSASRMPPLPPDTVPTPLLKELQGLVVGPLPTVGEKEGMMKPQKRLGWGPGAEVAFNELEAQMSVTAGLRQTEIDLRQRVAEQALKIAQVIAVGRGAVRYDGSGVVTSEDMEWGERIALESKDARLRGLEKYGPALSYSELCDVIQEALEVVDGHWMSRRDMDRKWGRRTKYNKSGVKDALDQLKSEGRIIEDNRKPALGGPMSAGWRLVSDDGE